MRHLSLTLIILAACAGNKTPGPAETSAGILAGSREAGKDSVGKDASKAATDSGTDAGKTYVWVEIDAGLGLSAAQRREFQGIIGTDWNKPNGGRQCAARKWAAMDPDDAAAWLQGEDNRIAAMPQGQGRGPHGTGGDGRETKRAQYFAMAVAIALEEPAFTNRAIDFLKGSILDHLDNEDARRLTLSTRELVAIYLEDLAPHSIDALRELMHAGERFEPLYRTFTNALGRQNALTDDDRDYLAQRSQFVPPKTKNTTYKPPVQQDTEPSDGPAEMQPELSVPPTLPTAHECEI